MAEPKGNSASAAFVRELRRALQQLYDPAELGKSPLAALLGVHRSEDTSSSLQHILLDAVKALKPASDVPPQANAWRIYHALNLRYVQQIPQRDIASSLALSVRQLRRQEVVALQVLADHLWVRYGLHLRPQLQSASLPQPGDGLPSPAPAEVGREKELEWLRASFPHELASVADLVSASLEVVRPLLLRARVRLDTALPDGLPRLAVQPVLVRQALVNLLTVAARAAPGAHVEIGAHAHGGQVQIALRLLKGRRAMAPLEAEDAENLEMAMQLVALCGGSLEIAPNGGQEQLLATLVLPYAEQLAVLVIDDNADTLELYQRYLEGTRYRFLGVRDSEQALRLARESMPGIIVLDVMLPGMDGWEVLGRLREHPITRGIPIIVCTILLQERLALTLGAAAFLRKPVSRADLLSALDAQARRLPRRAW